MATKKESTESVEEKKPKASTAKKTTTSRKPAAKKEDPIETKEAPKEEKPEAPKAPAIIDNTDEILKASDVELPPEEEPAGKQKIVVSHGKSAMADDEKIEVISAEEVLKDLEYDFETHEIKPYKGGAMTSHEMHQGKYGIIDDVTKDKKKK